LVIYFGGMVVRAWRWQYLLKPLKKVSIGNLFQIMMIGYMGNNVFPLRMGEVLRAVVLKRRDDVSISGCLATIVVEKIFDAVVVVGFVLLNLGQLARPARRLSLAQSAGWLPGQPGIFPGRPGGLWLWPCSPNPPSTCCMGSSSAKSCRNAGGNR
jgi:uncharacterized membrane protein YbhN (UPF0104 family)